MLKRFINRYLDIIQSVALVPGALILHAIWALTVGAATPMLIVGQLILLSVQVIAFIACMQAD